MTFKKNIFMPFVVLGDPTYDKSIELIKLLIDKKVGALELGFAFSDPIADGISIQKANKRALKNGITTERAFKILEEIRNYSSIPISLMLSFNLVYQYGTEKFYSRCKLLKIDAILCPDVPLEESEELVRLSKLFNLNQVFLVSPTTDDLRMKKIAKVCSGYLYLVSLLGTTGVRDHINNDLGVLIRRVKEQIDLPVYVGFGISKPEHVKDVIQKGADGAICGSAICKLIEDNLLDFLKTKIEISDFCGKMNIFERGM